MLTATSHAGGWRPSTAGPAFEAGDLIGHIASVRQPMHIVQDAHGRIGTALGGELTAPGGAYDYSLLASLPPLYPEWLGDRSFLEAHGVRFPYVAGAMANGIATAELVIAMAEANMLGFFGAGGLPHDIVERNIDTIIAAIGERDLCWGANLINSPAEPALEEEVADLYIRKGVRRVSASAYMRLTPSIVRYAYSGIGVDAQGRLHRPNHVFAKISRPEVASQFMSPAPAKILDKLVREGKLTAAEADLARHLPVAEDITVESDSGGHTDNRPLTALFPTILALRNELARTYNYDRPIRVGAAGGMCTPSSVAAAFSLGAAYVLTGSINQSAIEAGLSSRGKEMLAKAGVADVVMAPAPDMFELGVQVQVLQRGTLFAGRAQQLYDLYKTYDNWDEVPQETRAKIEKTIFQKSFDDVWAETEQFWAQRTPREAERARSDLRHRMALCFRWYVGLSSHWSIVGTPQRELDYQIWCGPAMGAFNRWVEGTFLEPLENRTVTQIARNLLEGAAVITRAQQLRTYGVDVPRVAFDFRPEPLG